MDFPLRNLNDTEKQSLTNAPIVVGILIGCADGELSANELSRIEQVIKTKTFSEQNDVHYVYNELANSNLIGSIETLFENLGNTSEERVQAATVELTTLNTILPKLNPTYALQFRDSLHDIAVEVAKASGGIFGIGSIGEEEKELLDLPMIDKF
ncbi:MAG: tellurite resistance protein [Bacteroidia bacterium]|jgi:tellurite resistance protein